MLCLKRSVYLGYAVVEALSLPGLCCSWSSQFTCERYTVVEALSLPEICCGWSAQFTWDMLCLKRSVYLGYAVVEAFRLPGICCVETLSLPEIFCGWNAQFTWDLLWLKRSVYLRFVLVEALSLPEIFCGWSAQFTLDMLWLKRSVYLGYAVGWAIMTYLLMVMARMLKMDTASSPYLSRGNSWKSRSLIMKLSITLFLVYQPSRESYWNWLGIAVLT